MRNRLHINLKFNNVIIQWIQAVFKYYSVKKYENGYM